MATPVNLTKKVTVYYNNPLNGNIAFAAADERFEGSFSITYTFYIGAMQDIPNLTFTSQGSAETYYEAAAWTNYLDFLAGSPALSPETFEQGAIVPLPDSLQEIFDELEGDVNTALSSIDAGDVTTGTFNNARIAQSNVTQHEAALSIGASQVTGTKTTAFISDFAETAQDVVGAMISGSNGISVSYNDAGNSMTISGPTPTFNDNVSRSLNSNYTIGSNVRGVRCSYSINVSWSLNALIGGNASAFLEYSTNNGSSWTTVNQVGKTLAVLNVTGADDLNLVGDIPPSATDTRIRTTSSNMTIAYVRGQETLI